MTTTGADNLQHGRATAAPDANSMTPHRLTSCAMAFWRSALLLSAYELGLFTELAAGPSDAATIESRLGLRQDATADFLEALVALDFVEQSDGLYRNTPEANLFLDPAKATYIGHVFAMARAAMREMVDLTTHLRAACANEHGHPSLSGRMWADIAASLRAAGAHDVD
jgi:hypothetical protein